MNFSAPHKNASSHIEYPIDTVRSRQAERNETRVLELEQAMFNHRSRYLVLFLTLNYQEPYRQWMTLEDIQHHRDQFLNNRRTNQLLRDIQGYVWKIEEGGMSGGLHLHVVIFYSGSHRADVQIARSIGEYWKHTITGGIGDYWNSNAEKDFHARFGHGIGTGQIDRHDYDKRDALRQNLRYVAKDDQKVTNRVGRNERMLGTSQFPR